MRYQTREGLIDSQPFSSGRRHSSCEVWVRFMALPHLSTHSLSTQNLYLSILDDVFSCLASGIEAGFCIVFRGNCEFHKCQHAPVAIRFVDGKKKHDLHCDGTYVPASKETPNFQRTIIRENTQRHPIIREEQQWKDEMEKIRRNREHESIYCTHVVWKVL